jgi:outer membrane immunogenic protein
MMAPVLGITANAGEWTGPYLGASIGADVISGEIGVNDTGGDRAKADGVGGGDLGLSLRAGYDYQLNSHLVVGLVGIYDWSNVETKASLSSGSDHASAELLKLDDSWTIAGRLGFLATPDLMLYALAGYTRVQFGDVTAMAPDFDFRLESDAYDALVLGAGVEYRLTGNWSLMAEYRQASLGERTVYSFQHDNGDTDSVWTDPVMHWARFGANYRFGGQQVGNVEPRAAPRQWSGFYAGGGLGLIAVTRDLAAPKFGDWDEGGFGDEESSAKLEGLGGGGFSATGTAGVDYRLSQFVVGAFANYDWSDHEISVSASNDGQKGSVDLLGLDRSWTIGGRAGYLVSEDVLVYGLIGYTRLEFNDVKVSFDGDGGTLGMPAFSGITIGGGFEKLLTGNLSLRLEYRYVDLGTETLYQDSDFEAAKITMDPSLHIARAGLSYRLPVGN